MTERSIQDLLKDITHGAWPKESFIIAIDGCGGSGKSRLAKELASLDSRICIVHFDDFYCTSMGNADDCDGLPQFDWKRLERELLIPLSQNKNAAYQRYDWVLNALDNWIEVNTGKIVIIEGVYSLTKALQKYYDYKIWVDCPLDIRLTRAKGRDKEYNMNTMDLWLNEWIPRENNYILHQNPFQAADVIIDGSGLNADIENGELHILDSHTLNDDTDRLNDNPIQGIESELNGMSKNEFIDHILDSYKEDLGNYYNTYKNHVYRVYNFAVPYINAESDVKTLAIASAFHDLGIWANSTFDYINPLVALARKYAVDNNLNAQTLNEIEIMIREHHKLTREKTSKLAEIFRQADLVDLTLGLIRKGRDKAHIKKIRETFPNKGFHLYLCKLFFKNLLKNPFKPLPMYKW
jgi:uridine kinase